MPYCSEECRICPLAGVLALAKVQRKGACRAAQAKAQASAHQAAKRALADAAEDLKRLEFRYQRSVEQLEGQIRHLQRSTWARDLTGNHDPMVLQQQPRRMDAQAGPQRHLSRAEAEHH